MYNPYTLTEKKILVTGASSGIGKEIAVMISKAGGELIITSRNEERLAQTFSLLEPGKHQMITGDLTRTADLEKIASKADDLDGIVLSAGIMKTIPFRMVTAEALNEVMQINFTSQVMLVNRLTRNKAIKNGSSVVFVSSIGGTMIGTVGNAVYSASKGAINGIQKVLALEFAAKKIRVNGLAPGMVKTNLWANGSISVADLETDEKRYPLGYGTPEDVAHAAVFLLSDASRWITGTNIVLDGGFSIQ